jgi:hypothetical protein
MNLIPPFLACLIPEKIQILDKGFSAPSLA